MTSQTILLATKPAICTKASVSLLEDVIFNILRSLSSLPLVQIAGLVARRIVCEVNPGEKFTQGNRFGIIRFGSRVDLYFPNSYKVLSKVGQTVVAGESLIAKK